MEEVKLLNNSDLNSLKSQSEKISFEVENLNNKESFNKKPNLKNGNRNLFLKILFFQFVVSCFVFIVLFSMKKIYPEKFKVISAQLNLAINEGPKFYDGLNSKINELNKNFSIKNISNSNIFNSNISNSNKVSYNGKELENKKNDVVSCSASSLNLKQENELELEKETIVDDDLEKMSADEGDVYFVGFVPPVDKGRVSSKFGPRIDPITKKKGDFHNGVDIVVGVGTPVRSIADGTVINANFSKKSGNFLIISHENGYESRFAHCQELIKKVGDRVKKNEKVALSGQTGNTTGAHLHLGLRKDEQWLDPKIVFPNFG